MTVRRIITFAFAFAIIALTVGLSGCEKIAPMVPDDKTTMPEMMDGEIPIGVAVALTGPFAEPYGLPMKRGFELAQEEINMLSDANLTLIPVDAQSSEEGGDRSRSTVGGSRRPCHRRNRYLNALPRRCLSYCARQWGCRF